MFHILLHKLEFEVIIWIVKIKTFVRGGDVDQFEESNELPRSKQADMYTIHVLHWKFFYAEQQASTLDRKSVHAGKLAKSHCSIAKQRLSSHLSHCAKSWLWQQHQYWTALATACSQRINPMSHF